MSLAIQGRAEKHKQDQLDTGSCLRWLNTKSWSCLVSNPTTVDWLYFSCVPIAELWKRLLAEDDKAWAKQSPLLFRSSSRLQNIARLSLRCFAMTFGHLIFVVFCFPTILIRMENDPKSIAIGSRACRPRARPLPQAGWR